MDPYRVTDDQKIWHALEKCHMKEEVEVAGGLDIHVKESGVTFSIGQRQLLCLARALLKSSKVLNTEQFFFVPFSICLPVSPSMLKLKLFRCSVWMSVQQA